MKLDAVVQFCYGRQCRQQAILEYFGEENAGVCGTCDICTDAFGGDAREAAG
jgi:ATP-dependent DNA helicase RecQ